MISGIYNIPKNYFVNNLQPHRVFKDSYDVVSFSGDNTDITDDIKNLPNLHCPSCGVAMLKEEDYINLQKEAQRIKTVSELANFFKKKQRYMPQQSKRLFELFGYMAKEDPDLPLREALYKIRYWTKDFIRKACKNCFEIIDNASNNEKLDDNDKALLKEIRDSLEKYKEQEVNREPLSNKQELPKYRYKEFKSLLDRNIVLMNNREVASELRKQIVRVMSNEVSLEHYLASKNSIKLSKENLPDKVTKEILSDIMKNVFLPSVREVSPVFKKREVYGADKDLNKIVMCKNCSNIPVNLTDGYTKKKAVNIMEYFGDLYSQIQPDMLSKYMKGLVKIIQKYSGITALNVDNNYISEDAIEAKETYITSNRPKLKLLGLGNTPCPICGVNMLTHKEKLNFIKDLDKTKNVKEVQILFERNKHHLKKENLPIFEVCSKVIAENPDISDEELVTKLRETLYKDVIVCYEKLEAFIGEKYDDPKVKADDRSILVPFSSELSAVFSKTTPNKEFPIKEYNGVIDRAIRNMKDKSLKTEFIDLIYRSGMQQILFRYNICFPYRDEIAHQYYDMEFKNILSQLFSYSVETIDHLVAKSRDGRNSTYNCMVMCKDCNIGKKSIPFYRFIDMRPEAEENIRKYLEFESKRVYKLGYNGYDKYLRHLADKLTYLIRDPNINFEYPDPKQFDV